eukprot:scaffold1485_cov31-Tisochrysis_lutea.AAC.1
MKCVTVRAEFRVTRAIGISWARAQAASSAAPGISLSVLRPSSSICSMIDATRSSERHRADRISSPAGTPARRYISLKSRLGTVRVPSMSKMIPRSRARLADERERIGDADGDVSWHLPPSRLSARRDTKKPLEIIVL